MANAVDTLKKVPEENRTVDGSGPSKKIKPGLLAAFGAGAAKSLLTDTPKGVIDATTQTAVNNALDKKPVREAFTRAALLNSLKSKGLGRAASGLAIGTLTFPLYASGVQDLKESKNPQDVALGTAKIVASGLAYQPGRRGVEYGWDALFKKKVGPKDTEKGVDTLLKAVRSGVSRAALPSVITSLGSAAAIGYGLRKNKKKEEQGEKPTSVLPLAFAAGLLGGGTREFFEQFKSSRDAFKIRNPGVASLTLKTYAKTPRMYLGTTLGRGLAQAIGTTALGGAVDWLLRKKKKD